MRPVLFALFCLTLAAQTPSFEVASIRPSGRPDPRINQKSVCGHPLSTGSQLASEITPLHNFVVVAYRSDVDDFDLPQWMQDAIFAVNVSIPPNTNLETCRQMLKSLLADRFHLVTAIETRGLQRYFLTASKSGPKLKPAREANPDPKAAVRMTSDNLGAHFTFRGASMHQVFLAVMAATAMERFYRPHVADIIDETGLTGAYDGEFHFTPWRPTSPQPQTLEDALAEQLGFILQLRHAPGKVLVIRSSDRIPTEN